MANTLAHTWQDAGWCSREVDDADGDDVVDTMTSLPLTATSLKIAASISVEQPANTYHTCTRCSGSLVRFDFARFYNLSTIIVIIKMKTAVNWIK